MRSGFFAKGLSIAECTGIDKEKHWLNNRGSPIIYMECVAKTVQTVREVQVVDRWSGSIDWQAR